MSVQATLSPCLVERRKKYDVILFGQRGLLVKHLQIMSGVVMQCANLQLLIKYSLGWIREDLVRLHEAQTKVPLGKTRQSYQMLMFVCIG